jgi:hypothetical protein
MLYALQTVIPWKLVINSDGSPVRVDKTMGMGFLPVFETPAAACRAHPGKTIIGCPDLPVAKRKEPEDEDSTIHEETAHGRGDAD